MVKKLLIALFVIVLFVILAGSVSLFLVAVDKPEGTQEIRAVLHGSACRSSAELADLLLKSVYDEHNLPSLSAAVGVGGELVWSGAIGYADLVNEIPADTQTVYRIGSISKSLSATAFMRLREQGAIELDTRFNEVVDDYWPENATFTMRQLLSHQAGIRHYASPSETFSNVDYSTTRDAAAIVEQDALVFQPGTDFQYSTYGYTLLSLAMERASGRSLSQIMTDEVFAPASMQSTRLEMGDADDASSAYLSVAGLNMEAPDVNLSYKYAGGGILSTPSDVVRFGNALLGEALLASRSVELLWTPVVSGKGKPAPDGYALGFRNAEDQTGRFVHHGGVSVGGYSFLLIYPVRQVVVAVVSNVMPLGGAYDRYALAKGLAEAFLR